MQWIRKGSLLVLALAVSAPVMARDVIGADEEEEEEKTEKAPEKKAPAQPAPAAGKAAPTTGKQAPADTKAAPAPAGGKAAPPAQETKKAPGKREKTEAELEAEQQAAEEAALKKAEEEARKKREEEAKKKSEQDAARKAKKEEVGKGNLEAARAERMYRRVQKDNFLTLKLRPGAVDANVLLEVVIDAKVNLEEPDPTYGDQAPMEGAVLFATFTNTSVPPPKDPKAKPTPPAPPQTYAIHPLGDAGSYGFHASIPSGGEWQVRIHGTRKDGKPVDVTDLKLFAAEWPPHDFDAEEKNNTRLAEGGLGGRRAMGE